MPDLRLAVEPRTVTGKKVRSLRRNGVTPAHLYGRETESHAIEAPTPSVISVLKAAGSNAIIDLHISGESEPRPVVLRGVQRHPVTDELIHIDFLQISLTESLRSDVPLHLVGEAPAVHIFGGVLLQELDHLTVEALPRDIPSEIEIDVTPLEELGQSLYVKDLPIGEGVTVVNDADQLVAKVEAPRIAAEIEAEEAAAAEEAALATEGEEGEAAEGAEEGEGETPSGEGEDSQE